MDSFSCVRDRIAAKRGKQGTPSLLQVAVGSVGSPGGMATMPPYSSEDVRNKKNWRRHLVCYIICESPSGPPGPLGRQF